MKGFLIVLVLVLLTWCAGYAAWSACKWMTAESRKTLKEQRITSVPEGSTNVQDADKGYTTFTFRETCYLGYLLGSRYSFIKEVQCET